MVKVPENIRMDVLFWTPEWGVENPANFQLLPQSTFPVPNFFSKPANYKELRFFPARTLTGCDLDVIIGQGPAPVRRGRVGRILRHRADWWWAGTNLDRLHHSALQGGPSPRTFPWVQLPGSKGAGRALFRTCLRRWSWSTRSARRQGSGGFGAGNPQIQPLQGCSAVRSSRAPFSGSR